MFFNRKKKNEESEKVSYCVGIMTTDRTPEDVYDKMADKIMDSADNVGILSILVKEEWDPSQLQILYRRFYQPDLSSPFIIINEFIGEDLKRETKKLEQEHKWKKFFGLLSISDYLEAENRAIHDFHKTLYLTEDVDQAIEFLKSQTSTSAFIGV